MPLLRQMRLKLRSRDIDMRELTVLCWLALAIGAASGTRVILNPTYEPTIIEMTPVYRATFENVHYYDLASAGLLNLSEVPAELQKLSSDEPGANLVKSDFKFTSVNFFNQFYKLTYLALFDERQALHVYDDLKDIELARGPQVDQDMCGLHLGYMQLMVEKQLANFRNSSDYSIFRIMHSSDGPDSSLAEGNTLFLGNHDRCVESKLNVIRDELSAINKSAADAFFEARYRVVAAPSLGQRLARSLGPLVGYIYEPELPQFYKHQEKIQLLGMRYCMASLRYPEWRNDTFARRNINLRAAICLPESCDSSSIELYRHQIKQLLDFNIKRFYHGYYLSELYCLPDEQSALRNPFNFVDSALFISFNVVWLTLVVVATGVPAYRKWFGEKGTSIGMDRKHSGWWHYLSSWSLSRNYLQLMAHNEITPAEESKDGKQMDWRAPELSKVNLEPMQGYKVVSALAVIVGHLLLVSLSNVRNLIEVDRFTSSTWVTSSMYAFCGIVDNFFVATGILTAYILMQISRDKLRSRIFWPLFIIHRYIRIVPFWALVHWFIQTLFRFLGSGPKWDYGTSHTSWISLCRNESIWEVFFPSANFKSMSRDCSVVGWYLANDVQFSLLVPILTMIFMKNYLVGNCVVVISTIILTMNHIRYYLGVETSALDIFGRFSAFSTARVVEYTWPGYVMPQYRCAAFLLGLAAGHLLVKYQRDLIREWPRWFVLTGKASIILYVYILSFLPFLFYLVPLENEWLSLVAGCIMLGTMHLLTSVTAAFFILLMCTGHLKTIAHYLSSDFLKPLAKMSLTTLLIHVPLLYYHSQSLTYLPEISHYHIFTSIVMICLESYALSFVIHLLYEMPLRKILVKILFSLAPERAIQRPEPPESLRLETNESRTVRV